MKVLFLYDGPHEAHRTWAESIGAVFLRNRFTLFRYEDMARPGGGKAEMKSVVSRVVGIPLGTIIQGALQSLLVLPGIRRNDPDVLLCEGRLGFVPGYIYKRLTGRRLMLITADPLIHDIRSFSPFWRKRYDMMLAEYDCIVSVSRLMYDLLPAGARRKAGIVRPPFNPAFFGYGADPASRGIVYVGLLNRQKGVDLSVEAFRRVRGKFGDSRFTLIGIGPLTGEIREMRLDGVALPGRVKELRDHFARASVYLHLARFDPSPVSVMEAMAGGLVPVVSRTTGTRDIVERVDASLVVGTPEEAAESICALFSSPGRMAELSARCREVVREYSRERSIADFRRAAARLGAGAAE